MVRSCVDTNRDVSNNIHHAANGLSGELVCRQLCRQLWQWYELGECVENFSNIKWTNVNGGDTIYISGGSTNQTYSQPLTVGAGGTAGSPIVITKGIDAGHNGKVIIDGAGADATGVFDNGYNYVIIQHLTSRIGEALPSE